MQNYSLKIRIGIKFEPYSLEAEPNITVFLKV